MLYTAVKLRMSHSRHRGILTECVDTGIYHARNQRCKGGFTFCPFGSTLVFLSASACLRMLLGAAA